MQLDCITVQGGRDRLAIEHLRRAAGDGFEVHVIRRGQGAHATERAAVLGREIYIACLVIGGCCIGDVRGQHFHALLSQLQGGCMGL